MTLEFIRLDESHTGKHLAHQLNECLKKYGIDQKLCILTMDNAGNCNTTATELAKINNVFKGVAWRGRCDLHIIQIAAKMVLSFFSKAIKRKSRKVKVAINNDDVEEVTVDAPTVEQEEDAEMQRLLDEDAAERTALASQSSPNAEARDSHDDAIVSKLRQRAIQHMADEHFVSVSTAQTKAAIQLIPRVTGLAKKTHDSNTIAVGFARLVADDDKLTTNLRTLATRCASRWNTEYDSLDSFLKLKGPVTQLLASPDFSLCAFKLTDTQWSLAQDLHDLLDCFKDVTLKLSKGGNERPLACDVIPTVEQLKADLLVASRTEGLADICRVAAYGGVLVLDKYLPLLAKCEAYVFAIGSLFARTASKHSAYRAYPVFRPNWKTKWFEENGWTPAEIRKVKTAMIKRFKDYKPQPPTAPTAPPAISSTAPVTGRAHFAAGAARTPTVPVQVPDSMESYLATPPIDLQNKSLLQFWHDERRMQPHLAEMALTYLSAPATSVDAERSFSEGRNQCAWNQHAMLSQTFREQMSVGAWSGAPFFDIGIAEEIIAKHSRPLRGPSLTQ
uniref:HAT C-terminal dimerisation domain-containing protein n=1 Tax=Mycena chlorophos TaxID=658473 RepID=A0ABQ0LG49_MYCCL|nr:predicted protein [Mycena chlorophos]